jgi:hypothetical protein
MGLFAKNKPDTQRMLLKSSKSHSMISSLQLKLSRSSSSSYDDDDGGKKKKIIASDDDGTRKKKFWRVLPEIMAADSAADPYIPPSGILPLQHAPVDPFASTSSAVPKNDTTMMLDKTNHNDHSSHIIRAAKPKKQGTFQRLDSMDDASYENIHQTSDLSKMKQLPTSAAFGKIHVPLKPSSMGKKHKNRLSKHMVAQKSKGAFTKLNNSSTPSSVGDVFSYRPPTFEPREPEAKSAPETKNGFLLDVIRYSSSGEEVFDVRSESTNCSSTQNSGSQVTPFDTSGIIHRCHSIGTESDAYSESMQSALYSDSGFPVPMATSTPHTFQQILFDESFRKITAISKSDAGSNTATYSDLAKAATQLTMVLSPEPKFHSCGPVAPSQPTIPEQATINVSRKMTDSSETSLEENERGKKIFSQDFVAPTSLPSRQNTKVYKPMTMNRSTSKNNWKSLPISEDDCDGRSVASNQSSQKSRREYQEAIRSKIRSPTKKKGYSNNRQSTAPTSGMNHGTTPFSSPISNANATFSNSVRSSNNHRDGMVREKSNRSYYNQNHDDPFLKAADFNVAQFPTDGKEEDDDDPFQIGVDVVESEDSAWNVNANPFQNLQNSSSNQSKDGSSTSRQQRLYGETVAKATSMDDGLIESIRQASLRQSTTQRGIDPENEENYKYGKKSNNESHGHPSNQMVRPSQSDSAIEYVQSSGYHHNASERQPQLKKKNVTKGVPANAIIGSMLFRQTETYFTDEHSDKKRKSKDIPTKQQLPKKSPRSGGGVDDDYDHNGMKVPRSVHADHAAKSDVSSVTEEASAFYIKNLLHQSSKWNESAQNILNQYNVQKKTLHARDTNANAHHL